MLELSLIVAVVARKLRLELLGVYHKDAAQVLILRISAWAVGGVTAANFATDGLPFHALASLYAGKKLVQLADQLTDSTRR